LHAEPRAALNDHVTSMSTDDDKSKAEPSPKERLHTGSTKETQLFQVSDVKPCRGRKLTDELGFGPTELVWTALLLSKSGSGKRPQDLFREAFRLIMDAESFLVSALSEWNDVLAEAAELDRVLEHEPDLSFENLLKPLKFKGSRPSKKLKTLLGGISSEKTLRAHITGIFPTADAAQILKDGKLTLDQFRPFWRILQDRLQVRGQRIAAARQQGKAAPKSRKQGPAKKQVNS